MAFAVQDCEFQGKALNTHNGAETAGKTGLVRCKDRDTGQMVREYALRDGQSIGLSRYFKDGKLAKEFTITANGPHEGLEREWAANGQLANGPLANLRCGPQALLAPHVDDAKLCGFKAPSTVSTYTSKGEVRTTSVWLAGAEQKATRFYANGKPELEEELQGIQKRETFYAEDGGTRREKLWDVSGRKRSRLVSDARYYLNGQP